MRVIRMTVEAYRRYKNQPVENVDYEITLNTTDKLSLAYIA